MNTTAPQQPVRSFHSRQGRISPLNRDVLQRHQGGLLVSIADVQRHGLQHLVGDRDVVLEIGCGFGEATVAMANADDATVVLAIDVHLRGLARLLRQVDALGLTNVRAVQGDARELLHSAIAPASLHGIRVYFPDPWPKGRHIKRRLLDADFVELAASRLRSGGFIHCATDWEPYAEQMLQVLSGSPAFTNDSSTDDGFTPRPSWRPLTRYESIGLAKGHVVHDLLFTRQ